MFQEILLHHKHTQYDQLGCKPTEEVQLAMLQTEYKLLFQEILLDHMHIRYDQLGVLARMGRPARRSNEKMTTLSNLIFDLSALSHVLERTNVSLYWFRMCARFWALAWVLVGSDDVF